MEVASHPSPFIGLASAPIIIPCRLLRIRDFHYPYYTIVGLVLVDCGPSGALWSARIFSG
jgi:hypothetical protein